MKQVAIDEEGGELFFEILVDIQRTISQKITLSNDSSDNLKSYMRKA
jgi:hypothetical protein